MATGPANPIARYVQEVVGAHDAEALTDSQLLERFVARREEAAFQALLRRHGPMVLGVCRRLLRDPHQADDAFQATFLVLVRRAGAIGRREALGAWLYRVAFRTAARAKMRTDRQRHREGPFADVPAPPTDGTASSDLRRVLDEELNRLPKKYRDPLVLRYLEEKPDQVVAAQLCWPLGTVKTRLAKARDLLRDRLARRGLALSAVALEAALGETTSAAVPAVLAEATAQAAILAAAGQTAGTVGVILLTEGVLHEMLRTNLTKSVIGALVLLGLLTAGTGWLLTELQADKPAAQVQQPAAPRAAPVRAVVPPELEWMPSETMGFITVQVANLWDGTLGRELRRQVPMEKLDGINSVSILLRLLEIVMGKEPAIDRSLGLGLPNLRRLTVLIPHLPDQPPAHPAVAITTRAPYAREKILRGIVPGAREQKVQGRSYHAGEGPAALYFVDAHTFLMFPRTAAAEVLPRLHPKKEEGPLHGALVLAGSTPIVIALNPKPVRAEFSAKAERAGPIFQASAIFIGIAPGKEQKADGFLNFPSRESKDEGAKAAKQAIALMEVGLAGLRSEIVARPQGLEQLLKIMAQTQAALTNVSVRQEGNRLHVPLRLQVDDRTAGAALGELLGIAIPKARTAAQHISSGNNLRQIALAMHQYYDKNTKFPAAAIYSKDGKPLLSWRVAILPYLEQEALYKEFKLDEPWDSEHNKKLLAKMPKVFASPRAAANEPFTTFYQVFNGKGSIFENKEPPSLVQISNVGGTSNTVLVVEGGEAVPWTKPADLAYVPGKPLPKLGGDEQAFPVAFADGHVQTLPKKWFEKNGPLIINWMNDKAVLFP